MQKRFRCGMFGDDKRILCLKYKAFQRESSLFHIFLYSACITYSIQVCCVQSRLTDNIEEIELSFDRLIGESFIVPVPDRVIPLLELKVRKSNACLRCSCFRIRASQIGIVVPFRNDSFITELR